MLQGSGVEKINSQTACLDFMQRARHLRAALSSRLYLEGKSRTLNSSLWPRLESR